MAPEVFLHKHYNETVDIFSFGIIVQEMFEGGPASRFQYPKEIAIARAKEGQRPPFTVNSYPKGMKQWVSFSITFSNCPTVCCFVQREALFESIKLAALSMQLLCVSGMN
jgi:serine/threonine protein kinase